MYCTFMLTLASLKMYVRNGPALFFSLFVPIFIMIIFGFMNFDQQTPMDFGLVTHSPNAATSLFVQQLGKIPAITVHSGNLEDELRQLHDGKRTAVLDVPDALLMPPDGKPAQLTAYVNQSRPVEANMAINIIHQMSDKATLAMSQAPPAFTINEQSVSVRHLRYIEFLLPGIIAMSVMQMSVFSVAFVFAQLREKGVLKRILATPVRPFQFVTANILTRLLMSLAQCVIFILLGSMFYHIQVQGSLWLLAVCVLLGSLLFLGLGFTISGLAKTMDTVPVLANLLVFPQLFLGNVFFAAGNMPKWLAPIAGHLPLTHFANALRAVMTEGATLSQVKWDVLGVLVWAVVLITLSMFTFRLQESET